MPAPIVADEEARQACLGRLRQIGDQLSAKDSAGVVTLADADKAAGSAFNAMVKMLGAMGMDDIARALDNVLEWGRP